MTVTLVDGEIAHPTLSDRVYQLLRLSIEQRDLDAGTRLVDSEIAARYNVSRTPVREAINRLSAEGLVTIIPRRGAFVVGLSPKDIADLYSVREVLEVLAVQSAVPLLTDADIDYLDSLIQQSRSAVKKKDYSRYFEIDRQFHDFIVEKSDNGRLIELYSLIDSSIQVSRWLHCDNDERMEGSIKEHQLIVAELKQRNVEQAAVLLSQHIKRVFHALSANDSPS